MDDNKCSICKTELEQVVVSSDFEMTWDDFDEDECIVDREDDTIFYVDNKAKSAGMQLRSLQCLMYNCQST